MGVAEGTWQWWRELAGYAQGKNQWIPNARIQNAKEYWICGSLRPPSILLFSPQTWSKSPSLFDQEHRRHLSLTSCGVSSRRRQLIHPRSLSNSNILWTVLYLLKKSI
jgi:hypothetical protein